MLENLGKVMRELLEGVSETLHVRSLQKARLRQSNTTIRPRENNPLKFSASVDEAFENLLFRNSDEYLDATESVRGAFVDINSHQRAVIDALYRAVTAYVKRFDPDDLEEKLSTGKKGALMGATNKLKYWDIYRDVYLVLSQHSENELPHAFIEDFASAYEEEVAVNTADAAKAKKKRKAG